VIIFILTFVSYGMAESPANQQYRVGIDDVLSIVVLDHRELSILAMVGEDGTVTYPYIGSVYVKGKTLPEIQDEITRKLGEGYVKYPVVTVSLSKTEMRRIFIHGEFMNRGAIPFSEEMTLLSAISLAGGTSNDGHYGRLIIKRKQKKNLKYDVILETGLDNGNIEDEKIENMPLKSDDILILKRNNTFLIQGQVAQRGRFILEKDMTVLNALLQAGGVSDEGLYGTITIRRKEEGETGGYKNVAESVINEGAIEVRDVEDILVQPDDVLVVGQSKTYFMYGEVNKVGEFVLKKDMSVFKALIISGGFTKWGSESRVKVLRMRDDASGFETLKINIEDVIDGDDKADILLKNGDTVIVYKGIF